MNLKLNRFILLASLVALSARGFAQEITVNAAKEGGVYAVGEKITWKLEVKGDGADAIGKINYVLKKDGLTPMGKGELTLQNGAAELETKLDEPGTILAEFSASAPNNKTIKELAGAAIAPEGIKPSAAEPADFEAFWKSKVEELQAVPVNPVLEAGQSDQNTVDYWKITLENIRGSKIRGQLAKPKTGEKFPALLVVQWAGVYPLQKGWATGQAKNGWLTLNINAHDLPIDEPAEFYKQQNEGPIKDYTGIGNDDREKSYFLRMYLSCYRAADYLTSRPDWDGKTLVVMGSSQGGLQAMMTGGFHPKVTALIANVPAGCDLTGPLVGRAAGWPQWYYKTGGKDAAKVIETSKYFDVVNFARRVKCPALVSAGLIDTTCPAPGIIAAFNQMQGPKELVVLEKSDHSGRNNTQAPFWSRSGAWMYELAAGKPAPVK